MTVLPKNNLRVMTFDAYVATSDGQPVQGTRHTHNLVFNTTRIDEEELHRLIETDAWELDNRVIDIPTYILENLQDLKEEKDENTYM